MKTILACLVLVFSNSAFALAELFDNTGFIGVPMHYIPTCKATFGWGRNTVLIDSDFGRSQCIFSHTERKQVPAEYTSFRYTVYTQHFNCTDGTSAHYSTDWVGANYVFVFHPAQNYDAIRCN